MRDSSSVNDREATHLTAASAYRLRCSDTADQPRTGWLREDVCQAIAQRRFSHIYQPVVRLSDRRVVAHEALLRLHAQPWLPPLSTATFVELAARWGQHVSLDEAVLEANATVPAWLNVAARSLQDATFVACLCATPQVAVEITAATAVDDQAAFAHGLLALKAAGATICLDDLCADDASLECMRMVRFDAMKLSASTVHAAIASARGRRVVASLTVAAARMGALLIAKSVETLPQAWLMEELGVPHAQGWLFGPPSKQPSMRMLQGAG